MERFAFLLTIESGRLGCGNDLVSDIFSCRILE